MKYIIILTFLLSSCSTLRRSKIVGAVTGSLTCGILGAYLGKELSPDRESDSFNTLLGGTVGASLCGIGGYVAGASMYSSDPRNMEDAPLEFPKKIQTINHQEKLPDNPTNISFSDLASKASGVEKIEVLKDVPEDLRKQLPKQEIIKYKVEPQTIKKNGKLYFFTGGEAIEHQYVEQ